MKKVLITGVSGFAGSFLAEELLTRGYGVSGTHISSDIVNIEHIKHDLQLFKVDLLHLQDIETCIAKSQPDIIFHLAALTSPSESFKEPAKVMTNNITSEMNIFEVVRKQQINSRILITSSAEIYGLVEKKDLPVSENAPLKPGSPYAVSKIAQDFLGLQYFLSYNMDIVRMRPFNHVGPRQSTQFVVASFAKQIADIEKGKQEPVLRVGNLDAKRDFTDVKDMVKAYVLLGETGDSGDVYNIGSGRSVRIKNILDTLLSFATTEITVELDPSKLRPSDTPDIYADSSKIKEKTGWEAQIPLEDTLKRTLDYFRQNV